MGYGRLARGWCSLQDEYVAWNVSSKYVVMSTIDLSWECAVNHTKHTHTHHTHSHI